MRDHLPSRRRLRLNALVIACLAAPLLLTACGGSGESPDATARDAADPAAAGATDEAARKRTAASADTSAAISWKQVPVLPDPLLDNLQASPTAHREGMWSGVLDWPINPIHQVLLPSGKLLTYGTRTQEDGGTGNQDGGTNVLWDPSQAGSPQAFLVSSFASDPKRQINSFCSSGAVMANGRVLTAGGFGGPYIENDTTAGKASSSFLSGEYSPETNLTSVTSFRTADERWYSTMITLADGRPILLGGMLPYAENSWSNPSTSNGLASMTPEVFTPGVGWQLMGGAYSTLAFGQYLSRSEFPHAWVAPNGEVFGISSDQMWFLDPKANTKDGQGSIRIAGTFKGAARGLRGGETPATLPNVGSSTSSAVMFAPGKALQMGGNGYWLLHDLPASSAATVIDFNDGKVSLTETRPMNIARRFFNSTVLPNGQVFVNGGTRFAHDLGQAAYEGEIWDPATGQWQLTPRAQRARLYHNTSSLLPSGVVLTGGGGNPGPVFNRNAEAYFPPYLFRQVNGVTQLAPRPTISRVDSFKVAHGGSLKLLLGTSGPIREAVLMGLTVVTHGFNTGQRRVPLQFSQPSSGRLDVTAPSANLAPPGYYMLVVVDDQGVPSRGVIVAVGAEVSPPPGAAIGLAPVGLSAPLAAPVLAAGDTAQFAPRLSWADAQVSWDFGDGTPATAFAANAPVTHRYVQPGVYTVTLSMLGPDGKAVSTYRFLQAVGPAGASTAATQRASGTLALETRTDGNHQLWVVNTDNHYVSAISTRNGARRFVHTGLRPAAVSVSTRGVVAVSNKQSGTLAFVNAASGGLTRLVTLPRGGLPHGVVFSPDGATAYVALEGNGTVARVDVATGALRTPLEVGGVIRHLSISRDGRWLTVSRWITPPVPGESTGTIAPDAGAGEVVVLDASTGAVARTVKLATSRLSDTAISGRGVPNYLGPMVLSPDDRVGLVPSKQDNIGRGQLRDQPPQALDFQSTVRAITSRVDLTTLSEVPSARVDHDNAGLAASAAFHPSGQYAFITLETSREVVVLDVANSLQLFRLDTGFAPQGVQVSPDGRQLYVHNFTNRSINAFDLTPLVDRGLREARPLATWVTFDAPAPNEAGKRLFYDARDPRLAADGYISCASCHSEGRHDGRTWDFTQFGEGLRNTPTLLGRVGAAHGRMHWTGNFDEVQDFEKQIRGLAGGKGLMSDAQYFSGTVASPLGTAKAGRSTALDQLAAYVNSLTQPEPSPWRPASGAMSAQAYQGYITFINRNCVSCHAIGPYTNSPGNRLVDIGTLKASSGQRLGSPLTGLDTPSLVGAWATAPYLHDGSAATLQDAIRAHTRTGVTLTAAEVENLARFVREIPY